MLLSVIFINLFNNSLLDTNIPVVHISVVTFGEAKLTTAMGLFSCTALITHSRLRQKLLFVKNPCSTLLEIPNTFSRTLMPGLQGAIKYCVYKNALTQFRRIVDPINRLWHKNALLKTQNFNNFENPWLNGKLIQAITLGIIEIE